MNLCSVLLIFFSASAANISVLTLAPFFPSMLAHKAIDPFYDGVIFASFSIPFIFSPPLLANYLLPSFGRVNTFVLGSLLLGAGMFIFSIIDFIPSKPVFVVAAILTRIIEGSGSALVMGRVQVS